MQFFDDIAKLDPYAGVHAESILFTRAGHDCEGYKGGQWSSFLAGAPDAQRTFAHLPDCCSTRVRLRHDGNGCDVTTDTRSASVALCLMALNHALTIRHERGRNVAALCDLYDALRDAAYDDVTLDHRAISAYLD